MRSPSASRKMPPRNSTILLSWMCSFEPSLNVVPAKAGTHTPCALDMLRRMGPGSAAGTTPGKSIRPHRALDRGAQHQPALGRGEIGARVRRAAVVPEQQVAHAPDMLVDEFPLLGMIEDLVEQRRALLLWHVEDADRHQPIDVDRLLAGVLVGAEHRMRAFAENLGAFAVAALGRAVIVVVQRLAAFE